MFKGTIPLMGIMVDNSTTTRKATDIRVLQQREEKYTIDIKTKQQDTDNLKKQQEIII